MEHTPLPWAADYKGTIGHIKSVSPDVEGTPTVCRYDVTTPSLSESEKMANADFIVRACNSHDDLVRALKVMLAEFCGDDQNQYAQASAEGQARGVLSRAGE